MSTPHLPAHEPEQKNPVESTDEAADRGVLGCLAFSLIPVLLLLSYAGFTSLIAYWDRYVDWLEPVRLLLMGVGGIAATIWILWRLWR